MTPLLTLSYLATPTPKIYRLLPVANLLLDHVGLPLVLVLAVHLVNLFGWMDKEDHSKTFLLLAL